MNILETVDKHRCEACKLPGILASGQTTGSAAGMDLLSCGREKHCTGCTGCSGTYAGGRAPLSAEDASVEPFRVIDGRGHGPEGFATLSEEARSATSVRGRVICEEQRSSSQSVWHCCNKFVGDACIKDGCDAEEEQPAKLGEGYVACESDGREIDDSSFFTRGHMTEAMPCGRSTFRGSERGVESGDGERAQPTQARCLLTCGFPTRVNPSAHRQWWWDGSCTEGLVVSGLDVSQSDDDVMPDQAGGSRPRGLRFLSSETDELVTLADTGSQQRADPLVPSDAEQEMQGAKTPQENGPVHILSDSHSKPVQAGGHVGEVQFQESVSPPPIASSSSPPSSSPCALPSLVSAPPVANPEKIYGHMKSVSLCGFYRRNRLAAISDWPEVDDRDACQGLQTDEDTTKNGFPAGHRFDVKNYKPTTEDSVGQRDAPQESPCIRDERDDTNIHGGTLGDTEEVGLGKSLSRNAGNRETDGSAGPTLKRHWLKESVGAAAFRACRLLNKCSSSCRTCSSCVDEGSSDDPEATSSSSDCNCVAFANLPDKLVSTCVVTADTATAAAVVGEASAEHCECYHYDEDAADEISDEIDVILGKVTGANPGDDDDDEYNVRGEVTDNNAEEVGVGEAASVSSERSYLAESQSRGPPTVLLTSPTSFALLFKRCQEERDAWAAQCEDQSGDSTGNCTRDVQGGGRATSLSTAQVLCAERVSQMTKTYNDIEAVTRLLEEKERDLELAARIGQTLLSKNKELSSRAEGLEEQLGLATERVNQLRHEMGMKDELLRVYSEDLERDGGGDTPTVEKAAIDGVNVDFLEKKVKSLEDENLHLRLESASLQSATSNYEDKEKKLVEDCIQQLAEVNQQVESFAAELQLKSEENMHQKEEIKTFLAQVSGLQTKVRKLTLENMDMHDKLTASTESQRKLTKELGTMQDRYDELLEMLEEAQDELRLVRSRHRPRSNASSQQQAAAFTVPTDSLASELENSLRQEQLEQAVGQRRAQSWRVFETARAAKKAAAKVAVLSSTSTSRMSISASGDATGPPSVCDSQLSVCTSDVDSQTSDGYSGDLDSLYESNSELGRPGIPGSCDLENALRRLATRRANEMNEREFLAREREEQRIRKVSGGSEISFLSSATHDASGLGEEASSSTPRSPGSVSSVWSSATGAAPHSPHCGQAGGAGQGYKISDKLQIVKPMEGSMTLRHWKHLANPHLGGLFEQRDGIQLKGEGKHQDPTLAETYSMSDVEEDGDESHDIHTRREQDQGLIYTFTDSRVQNLGPYRGLGTLFDSRSPQVANVSVSSLGRDSLPVGASTPKFSPSSQPSASSTPKVPEPDSRGPDKKDSPASSYSISLGLASLLQTKESPIVGRSLLRASSIPKLNLSDNSSGRGGGLSAVTSSDSNGFVSLSARVSSSVAQASRPHPTAVVATTSTFSALDLNPPWSAWASRSTGNLSSFPAPATSSSSSLSTIWRQNKLPGSGSFEEGSLPPAGDSFKTKDDTAVSISVPASPRRPPIFTPGMTGQGLLQQLKSKGLSLYGLWSGKVGPESQDQTESWPQRPLSGTSIDDRGEACQQLGTALSLNLTDDTEGEECGEAAKPTAESILPGDSGVLGALANFRRSGIL